MTALSTLSAHGRPPWLAQALADAAGCRGDVDRALQIALDVGRELPLPGSGRTAQRWQALADLAAADVTVARVVEAHTDALAILAEAGDAADHDRTWGVFAAEGPGARLEATAADAPTDADGDVTLSGDKPWCSLGGVLDRALVTAWTGDERALFAVRLRGGEVTAQPAEGWVSRGLPGVVSVGLHFDRAPARQVGAPSWYLTRPGFAWGGIGVAACWYGAAAGVATALAGRDDDLRALAAGRVDVALHAAATALIHAAVEVDAGRAAGDAGAVLALRTRSVVAAAAEEVLAVVGRATGPAPLAFDERHAARVADLQIYLRQHHGERDLAELGRQSGRLA